MLGIQFNFSNPKESVEKQFFFGFLFRGSKLQLHHKNKILERHDDFIVIATIVFC